MKHAITHGTGTAPDATAQDFVPLDQELRTSVPTDTAAWHLSRESQTLRIWACKENGPIRPIRINGRLAWPVAELRRILGVTR